MRFATSHAKLSYMALLLGASFFTSLSASAQTPAPAAPAVPVVKPKTPPPPPPKKPVTPPAKQAPAKANTAAGTNPAAPAKPGAPANAQAPARKPVPAAGTTASTPGAGTPGSSNVFSNGRTNPFAAATPGTAVPGLAPAQPNPSISNVAANSANPSSEQRPAVATEGLHVFHGTDFSATAYGCYRSGTRVLCDFDVTKLHPAQGHAAIWRTMQLIDSGGKINPRHDAYFLFEDGSKAPVAYLSETPVRMIMEFDNIGANITSVTLSNGADRAESVPITTAAAQSQNAAAAPAAGSAVNP